jgi:hypothetical protein
VPDLQIPPEAIEAAARAVEEPLQLDVARAAVVAAFEAMGAKVERHAPSDDVQRKAGLIPRPPRVRLVTDWIEDSDE